MPPFLKHFHTLFKRSKPLIQLMDDSVPFINDDPLSSHNVPTEITKDVGKA